MPDAKISDLPDGSPPQDTDEYVIARAGSNFSLSYGDMTAGGSSSLSGVGAVTVATNGNTVSVGAPAQSVQSQNLVALTLSGNTSGALALASSGTVTLAGGNNITLSQAGNAITISGANVGGAQTGISGISASDTLYTSGTVRITGVGGGVTVSSNTGQRIDISVAAQSVQPETQTFVAGISASDTLYTSGNVRFTGVGGGITVSSNTGQRVDLSVAAPVAQTNQAGSVYAISNTSGTSSGTYDARTLSIAGAGIITVAASNSGWRINASQSVQPETQTFIGGISASDTLYTSGNVRFTGSQAVTVRSGAAQLVVIDAPAQTTQTQGILSAGVSTGGNTAGNTQVSTGSRLVFVGSGMITASQGTAAGASTITLNATQSVQPETQTFIGGISASDTLYTSGSVRFTGVGGGVTVSSNTGQRVDISVAAPVAATNLSVGASNIGNTAGDTGVATGSRLVIAGGNNITISQGTAAGATTLTISAPNLGAGAFSGGVSNLGNSAGDTGITGTRLILAGGNNITLSQATDANGGTVSFVGGAAGGFSAGVSNLGNTAGDTGVTGTRLVLVGSGPISLSQATDANGATISVLSPNGYLSNWPAQGVASGATTMNSAMFATAATRTTLSAMVWPMGLEAPLSVNRAILPVLISISSSATNSNWSWTMGQSLGLYTMNAGTLSLVSSFSNQQRISYASTNNSTNASASWQMSYGSGAAVSSSSSISTNNAGATGLWSSISQIKAHPFAGGAFSLSGGQYVAAFAYSSASAGANVASISSIGVNSAGALLLNEVGLNVASTTANSFLQGRITVTQTNTGMPASFSSADVTIASNNASIINRPLAFTFLSR